MEDTKEKQIGNSKETSKSLQRKIDRSTSQYCKFIEKSTEFRKSAEKLSKEISALRKEKAILEGIELSHLIVTKYILKEQLTFDQISEILKRTVEKQKEIEKAKKLNSSENKSENSEENFEENTVENDKKLEEKVL
jgi:hypothetical protein